MKKLGLYFHIPFCNSKCNYCDFDSKVADYENKKNYVEAIKREIDIKKEKYDFSKYMVDSVFIGGGTPTALEADLLDDFLKKIEESFDIGYDTEYTIEMNPNSFDRQKIEVLKSSKINRISIGLQSANENELKRLGRTHNFEDFLKTYIALRESGYKNISADLMMGTPGQNFDSYRQSLKKLVDLNVDHISSYMLIVEPGTVFGKLYDQGRLEINDNLTLSLYEYTISYLKQHGYFQYEISNFSKKGKESIHNIKYWKLEPYIGFGQSAHSFFEGKRFNNRKKDYIKDCLCGKDVTENIEIQSKEEIYDQWIFLKLRMNEGIDFDEIDREFNMNFREKYSDKLENLYQEGLINSYKKSLSLTTKGFEVSNRIYLEFM